MSFVSFGMHIFGDKTLQHHLSKLIMNVQYLSSTGFKSMRVGLIIHGSSFNDAHLVAKELLKLNNPINILVHTCSYLFIKHTCS